MTKFGLIVIGIVALSAMDAKSCTLTMGYRTNERLPLIAKAPDNTGLYLSFYHQVTKRIGCELNVIRGPKRRILKHLKDGEIDFYPGFTFNEERSRFAFYIENGFPGGDVGISRSSFINVSQLTDLEGHTVLQALGSPNFVKDLENVRIYQVPEMTIDKAVTLLRKKRGDFYIYNRASLEYYMRIHQPNDMKLQLSCCGGTKPLYLGFSRKSQYYAEEDNPEYDSHRELSPDNFPTRLSKPSIANQLRVELLKMMHSGETYKLYREYY